MSVTLEPVFNALGYDTPDKRRGMIKLLQAAGAFGRLSGVDGVLSDQQADAVLKAVTFDNARQAADWLHDLSQETMLRPEGQSRTDTTERDEFITHHAPLVDALRQAGVLSEARPTLKHYDHVLLLGSKEPMVETRMHTIKQLWDEGIRFDKIHLLGNERPLDESHEPIATMVDLNGKSLSNETEMLKAHYYNMRDDWPEDLKQVPTYAVYSYDRDERHANTKDTIDTWLSMHPEPDHGNVLVISNQPYVGYQNEAVCSVLPPSFNIDTVGAPVDDRNINVTLAMDALARQIDVNFHDVVDRATHPSVNVNPPLVSLDPSVIKADPETYQFRSNYDNAGVTEEYRHAEDHWDPILHGNPLLVHERLDGTMYVADGHHRLNFAQKLNSEGRGPGNVSAIVLREADGYTPEDIKIIAAYRNIAQGHANPVEAARVFKEAYSGKVHTELLPQLQMDKGNLNVSYRLSKLSDRALDEVERGEIPVDVAADVAAVAETPESQDKLMESVKDELKNAPSFAARYTGKTTPASFTELAGKPEKGASSHTERVKRSSSTDYTLAP